MRSASDSRRVKQAIIEQGADRYTSEMEARSKMNARIASNEAHAAAQEALTKQYPKSVVAEEPTGITGPEIPRSDVHLRRSDIQINRQSRNKTSLNAEERRSCDRFQEFGVCEQDVTLIVDLRDKEAEFEKTQIQSYEIRYRQHDVPAFITNARGEIYAPNPDAESGWILVGRVRAVRRRGQ